MRYVFLVLFLAFAMPVQAKEPELPLFLVLGDEFAAGLASHLSFPGMETCVSAKPGDGIMAGRNWVDGFRVAMGKRAGKYALISLGAHDLVPIKDGREEIRPLSERWKREYARRMAGLFKELRAAGVRPVWLEIPPMRDGRYARDAAELSRFQSVVCLENRVPFLPVRADMLDRHREYTAFSPDDVRWRSPDGMHLTDVGNAFWASLVRLRFPY